MPKSRRIQKTGGGGNKDAPSRRLAYVLMLVGLVFLIESIFFIFVLSQIPSFLLGATTVVAWVYTIIKFVAGILAIYDGIERMKK